LRTAAVICEFNPFHNGHKHLIDTVKKKHADVVVAIMSGSFVQRGDIAVVDKYQRALCALQNGCDLVVELPTVFAISSAPDFVKGGVDIAKALNADMLCFGAEDNDTQKLIKTAEIFDDTHFCEKLKEFIKNGEYYPKAVSNAVADVLGSEYSQLLSKPNNTLAIEYIKSLKHTGISPVAIKRVGAEHDSSITTQNIASATHIRSLIFDNKSYNQFTDMNITNHADISKLETAILYKLRTMQKEDFANLPDIEAGLHNRLYDCARSSNSLEELYNNIKTKRYTLSRIRRIIINALLGITKYDKSRNAMYVRVLGMNNTGAKIIKNASLPIIAKIKQDYDRLSNDAKKQFDFDVRASEIYSLALNDKSDFTNDFSAKIIKI